MAELRVSTGMIVHGYVEDVEIRSSQFHIKSAKRVISQPAG